MALFACKLGLQEASRLCARWPPVVHGSRDPAPRCARVIPSCARVSRSRTLRKNFQNSAPNRQNYGPLLASFFNVTNGGPASAHALPGRSDVESKIAAQEPKS